MKQFAGLLLALAALLAGAVAPAAAQDDGAELRIIDVDTEGNDVTLTVGAPDQLLDVSIDDGTFLVVVDGVQRIPEVEPIRADELEVVIVIDASGSMEGSALAAAKQAAALLIDELPLGTRYAVVSFGDDAVVESEFSTDQGATRDAIDAVQAGGNTALYKAVVTAAAQFDPRSTGSRNIVLLSDGGNTVEESSLGLAQSAVQATGAKLYAVSLQTTDTDVAELDAMAADSGGSVTAIDDSAALDALFRDFAVVLRNQYRLSFEGSGSGQVEVFVAARVEGQTIASTTVGVQLPIRAQPRPTSTPVPAIEDDSFLEAASAPAIVTIEAEDRGWLRWAASGALATSIGIFGYLLLFPSKRRRNPLRDMAPVISRAGVGGVKGLQRVPDMLTASVGRVLSRGGRGASLARWLEAAGLQIRNAEFLVLVTLVTVTAFFVGAWFSLAFGIVLGSMVSLGFIGAVAVMVARRRQAFADQLNGTLQLMAGSLRTGYSLPQVFDVVAREAQSPTSEEFTRVVVETRLGRDLVDACREMGDRMENEDFHWVTNAIQVTREIGGDLAEVLDNVAETIRARERIRRQISALSAEGRISAIILGILPVPMFLWQLLVNREYTLLLFNTSMGRAFLFGGIALLVIGIIWMRKLVQLEF